MVKFSDIKFKPHSMGVGLQGTIFFPGGYGISCVRFKSPFGDRYMSYTSNEDEWEVAILKGNETDWEICYDTPLTNDVLGYQTKEDIEEIMKYLIRLH
jgi:hypothetical protein